MGLFFLAYPVGVMSDPELTAVDIRVLGTIAWHDRFNKNGRGCYATLTTIARMASCDTRSVKRATGKLRDRGYIVEIDNKRDRRGKAYRVEYVNENGDKIVPNSMMEGWQDGHLKGDKDFLNPEENQSLNYEKDKSKKIASNAKSYAVKRASFPWERRTALEGMSATPWGTLGVNEGGRIAILERNLKAGQAFDRNSAKDYLEGIIERGGEFGDPNIGRATRVLDLIDEPSIAIDD